MAIKKKAKHKSSYSGIDKSFEKKRQPAWVKQNFNLNKNNTLKTKFTTFLRKNP